MDKEQQARKIAETLLDQLQGQELWLVISFMQGLLSNGKE